MAFIRTVLGDIPAAQAGVTYAHEHLIIEESFPTLANPDFLLKDVDKVSKELTRVYQAGGRTMVDTMPANCGRNVLKLAEVSRRTGIQIVAPTGIHLEQYYPLSHWRYQYSEDQLTRLFVADVTEGIDAYDYNGPMLARTPHKAGMIKLATGDDPITPHQALIFRAVVNTHLETGVPILTHTNAGRHALEQAEKFTKLGADLHHVVISHMDRHSDLTYHRNLLQTGIRVEFDSAFRWKTGDDNQTYRLLEALLPDFPNQIMAGMDAARNTYWQSYGGKPGLTYLMTTFHDELNRRGLGDYWQRLMIDNPASLYSFSKTSVTPLRAKSNDIMQHIAMLGGGFIGRFYAESLHGQRSRDRVVAIYARREETAQKFAADYGCAIWSTDMEEVIAHPDITMVCVALPNNLHATAVELCAKHKKNVICTKPLGRTADEALQMMQLVEEAGIFGGYLEDLCYSPKFLKALESVKSGALGRILWAKSREAHPGPHSNWFWDKEQAGGGCMLDLGCHCVEIARSFIGKDVRPVEVMCWAATQVKPIDAEDHAIALVKYENGAIGQFEVSWVFRGGMDLRDEVMGTEGTIWINNFLRTGFEMYTSGKGADYVAEKAESNTGWLFPVGDEVNDLGYNHMFTDMFTSCEEGRQPAETFYDGYVVNAILDAAYRSAESKQWEPVDLPVWRGQEGLSQEKTLVDYDADYYLIKEELTHDGRHKLILKDKVSGKIIEKDLQVNVPALP